MNKGTVEIKAGILLGHTTTKRGRAIYNEGSLVIIGGQLLDNRTMARVSKYAILENGTTADLINSEGFK